MMLTARILIKLLALQIAAAHCARIEPPLARLIDYKTSEKLVNFLNGDNITDELYTLPVYNQFVNSDSTPTFPSFTKDTSKFEKFLKSLKAKFGWIYNATVPHGYIITDDSYNVPVYNKFSSNGSQTFAGYTKDYIVEPDDSKDEFKTIPSELTMFEKFERFKNNVDLLFMTKVILKILVFKKIVKFIALVCLLFFLPTINDNEEASRNLKHRENSTSELKIKLSSSLKLLS